MPTAASAAAIRRLFDGTGLTEMSFQGFKAGLA
jgi:hypothetical protein